MKAKLLLFFLILGVSAYAQSITISQNNNPNIVEDSGVACRVNETEVDEDAGLFLGMFFDNYFARAFDLENDHGIDTDFTITSIEVGQGFGRNIQVEINVYTANTTDLTDENLSLTLLQSEDVFIIEQANGTVLFVPTNIEIEAGEIVVVEIFAPNSGTATDEEFFIGTNTSGQTGPPFLKAPGCQINEYVDISTFGLGDQAYLINIVGQETLSINQTELDKIEVYPNPVANQVHLNLPAGMVLERASLTDMGGKLRPAQFTNGVLDASHLASGQYILTLQTSAGSYTHKLLKK